MEIEYGRIDDESEDEIDHYATCHNEKALISLLTAKLRRLCWRGKFLCSLRFINHTVYLAVASYWEPTDTILGTYFVIVLLIAYILGDDAVLLASSSVVPVFHLLEEVYAFIVTLRDRLFANKTTKPVVITAPEVELPVCEDIKARYSRLEKFRKCKVSAFMKEDKQCYREDKLRCSY